MTRVTKQGLSLTPAKASMTCLSIRPSKPLKTVRASASIPRTSLIRKSPRTKPPGTKDTSFEAKVTMGVVTIRWSHRIELSGDQALTWDWHERREYLNKFFNVSE